MVSPQQKSIEAHAYFAALQWYEACGVDVALYDEAQDRRKALEHLASPLPLDAPASVAAAAVSAQGGGSVASAAQMAAQAQVAERVPLGANDARAQAIAVAQEADSLEALREGIAGFEGLSIKRTATNMVFSDGHTEAPIMILGEAPGTDEDRTGVPFVGQSGALLDMMLDAIDFKRKSDDIAKSVYISNILNWRPPGNRSPSQSEIDVSLPLIEKHIMLVQPKILVLCGSVAAKALLGRSESISRLRGVWHDYSPLTSELNYTGPSIPAIATYHPAYLLRTPAQKRAAWHDLLEITHKLKAL